jgi:orotate phosphoribosyltransferase
MSTELAVAEKLMQVKAIQLNLQDPYTWASGWRSPIYCDNRKTLSHPHVREFIKSELSNAVFQNFPEADVIAGVVTAGVPWGAMVADQIKLPFVYVRSAPKAHGLGNQIEGELPANAKVVVIEDLISTGKSSMEAIEALKAAGADVVGIAAIFTYGFELSAKVFAEQRIPMQILSNYDALCTLAGQKGMFTTEELAVLAEWRTKPSEWGR